MKTLNFKGVPNTQDLVYLYDNNAQYKEVIKVIFKNSMYCIMQRKYTFKGNNIIKTSYFHAVLYLPDGREHTKITENKTGFKIASYYK